MFFARIFTGKSYSKVRMKKQENLLMKGKWLTGALVLAMAAVTLAGCGAKDETKKKWSR